MIREIMNFAKKYNLEIKTVVRPKDKDHNFKVTEEPYTGEGFIINSEFFEWCQSSKRVH